MPQQKQTERLNLAIDQTLKRQFYAICALRGLSMNEVNQDLIAQWVKENAPPGLIEDLSQQQGREPSKSQKKGGKQTN
jgi:antitoxin component of RelBE/YafQ-DinJ toxin-antitoxin module